MALFYGWGSTLQSQYEEAVYFLSLSSHKFLVLIWSTLEGWKAELTLEAPTGPRDQEKWHEVPCLSFGVGENTLKYTCKKWINILSMIDVFTLIYKNTIFEGIFQLKDRVQQTIKTHQPIFVQCVKFNWELFSSLPWGNG